MNKHILIVKDGISDFEGKKIKKIYLQCTCKKAFHSFEINCQMMDWCDFHYRDMPAMRDTKTEPCDRVIEYYNNKNRTGDVN